jgi:hypothetical protein
MFFRESMISNSCAEENFRPTLSEGRGSTPSSNKWKMRLGYIIIYLGINTDAAGIDFRLRPIRARRIRLTEARSGPTAEIAAQPDQHCSDPSQAASELIASVDGGATVTAAWVGVGGHQLGGDGRGGAAH